MIYRFLTLWCLLVTLISCKGHDSKENKITNNQVLGNKTVNNQTFDNKILLSDIWRWRSEDKSQEFTIKILKITNDSLFAQYCAVYDNGQKLDCDFDENINIKAVFDKNRSAYIGEFHSFFNSGKGICLVKILDKNLVWEILKMPAGEYFAPTKCILKEENNNDEITEHSSHVTFQTENEKLPYDKIIDITNVKYYKINTSEIEGLDEFSCGEIDTRYLPIFRKDDKDVILVPQDCGDFPYRFFLLTVKNNTVKDNLYVEGEWYEPDNTDSKEKTSFLVDKKYKIEVKTQSGESVKIQNYKINEDGKIIDF